MPVIFGISRGSCTVCGASQCPCYNPESEEKGGPCKVCGHFPSDHENLGKVEDPKSMMVKSKTYSKPELPDLSELSTLDLKDLVVGDKLGEGVSAEVFKGTFCGKDVAIKVLKPLEPKQVEDLKKELNIMSALSSPNIVSYYGTCAQTKIYVVMELCTRGSLYQVLHQNSLQPKWTDLFSWITDAIRGLAALHSFKPPIVHRDLKTLNLLVDENWVIKVCDFGLSRVTETGNQSTLGKLRGTFAYCAPEIYNGSSYGTACDIYSMGVILWELMMRIKTCKYARPFGEFSEIQYDFQIIVQTANKGLRPTIPNDCPSSLSALIRRCWDSETAKRPDCAELEQIIGSLRNEYTNNTQTWDATIIKPVPKESLKLQGIKPSSSTLDALISPRGVLSPRTSTSSTSTSSSGTSPPGSPTSNRKLSKKASSPGITMNPLYQSGGSSIGQPAGGNTSSGTQQRREKMTKSTSQYTGLKTLGSKQSLARKLSLIGSSYNTVKGGAPPASARGNPSDADKNIEPILSPTTGAQQHLHNLCTEGNLDGVKKYLTKENVNSKDSFEQTPLHLAAIEDHPELVSFLVENGANVNAQDKNGWTPLHGSCSQARIRVSIYLVQKGCSVQTPTNDGTTALHYLVRKRVQEKTLKAYLELMQLMLSSGLDINIQNKNGETPLHQACTRGSEEAFRFLLEQKADPNLFNGIGETPLHIAVLSRNLPFVNILLKFGAEPKLSPPKSDLSALKLAKRIAVPEIIKALKDTTTTTTTTKDKQDKRKKTKSKKEK